MFNCTLSQNDLNSQHGMASAETISYFKLMKLLPTCLKINLRQDSTWQVVSDKMKMLRLMKGPGQR